MFRFKTILIVVVCFTYVWGQGSTALSSSIRNVSLDQTKLDLSDTDLVFKEATIDESDDMVYHAIIFNLGAMEFAYRKKGGFNPDANSPNGLDELIKSIYPEYASLKTTVPYQNRQTALGNLAYTVIFNPKYDDLCMEFYIVSDRDLSFDRSAREYLITGHFCSISQTTDELEQTGLNLLNLIKVRR